MSAIQTRKTKCKPQFYKSLLFIVLYPVQIKKCCQSRYRPTKSYSNNLTRHRQVKNKTKSITAVIISAVARKEPSISEIGHEGEYGKES